MAILLQATAIRSGVAVLSVVPPLAEEHQQLVTVKPVPLIDKHVAALSSEVRCCAVTLLLFIGAACAVIHIRVKFISEVPSLVSV